MNPWYSFCTWQVDALPSFSVYLCCCYTEQCHSEQHSGHYFQCSKGAALSAEVTEGSTQSESILTYGKLSELQPSAAHANLGKCGQMSLRWLNPHHDMKLLQQQLESITKIKFLFYAPRMSDGLKNGKITF